MILDMQNAIASPAAGPLPEAHPDGVAGRIARRTLARRVPDYANEVRRLLDAGLEVMRRCGTSSRPRVADIVAAAGLSNDAFYRHFPSKDALVLAILEDGTERLASYLAHQMSKEREPARKLRRWVEGVLAQAIDEEVAAATLAVLWNASSVGRVVASGPPSAAPMLARLLHEPLAALGSTSPPLDAMLVAHAVIGVLSDHLWQRTKPSRHDVDHVVDFCLRAVGRRRGRRLAGGQGPR
jgi:AcrR family transcriptional regulator